MTEPEQELGRRIARHLDAGVDHLDAAARNRLLAARSHALSRYREQPEAAPALAWAGRSLGPFGDLHGPGARRWLVLCTVVVVLGGVAYWKSSTPARDIADIDTSLLTDELPINAYLDKGFDSWLKRPSR